MVKQDALAPVNTEAIVGGFTKAELDTLKATIARGTTDEQFALFVQTCARSGLNPFLNQIYCIVYQGKDGPVMSIQIAVEGIVALAKRHPQYKGFIASEVKENDEFEIDMVTGEPKHRITTMQRGKTVGAYCVAYREGAPNVAVVVTADQVEHLVKGRNGQMWRDYFDDMIVKHAIKRAFKRQFGIEVAEDEHVPAAVDTVPEYRPRPDAIDVTSQVTASEQPVQTAQPAQPEDKPDDEAATKEMLTAEIKEKFKRLGITNAASRKEFFDKHGITFANPKDPTVAEMTGVLKVLDMELAKQADDDLLE